MTNHTESNVKTNAPNACCDLVENGNDACQVTKRAQFYRSPVDVFETESSFTIMADMPGTNPDEIEISVENQTLEITGKVDDRYEGLGRVSYREYGLGDFHRRFRIGDGIDVSGIEATMKDGVLTVSLPKWNVASARTIEVRAE